MSRLERSEGSLFDLSIYELLPTPQGALRVHLSEFSSSPESIQEHAELLAECSDTFRFGVGTDD